MLQWNRDVYFTDRNWNRFLVSPISGHWFTSMIISKFSTDVFSARSVPIARDWSNRYPISRFTKKCIAWSNFCFSFQAWTLLHQRLMVSSWYCYALRYTNIYLSIDRGFNIFSVLSDCVNVLLGTCRHIYEFARFRTLNVKRTNMRFP